MNKYILPAYQSRSLDLNFLYLDLWIRMFGSRSLDLNFRISIFGSRFLDLDLWICIFGSWSLNLSLWILVCGSWSLDLNLCISIFGSWSLGLHHWILIFGSWSLTEKTCINKYILPAFVILRTSHFHLYEERNFAGNIGKCCHLGWYPRNIPHR